MRQFSAADIEQALDYRALADALSAAFADPQVEAPLRLAYEVGGPACPGHLLMMPAWRRGARFGVKLVNVFPNNGQRGLGAVNGVYVLFDGQTGLPEAVMDSDALTNQRTAATSLLAARYLAREDARTLLVVGTGHLAPHLARAHGVGRRLEKVMVHGRSPRKAHALAARLAQDGLPAVAVEDLSAAVPQADIVSCATTSRAPLILGAWVRPGAHVDLVGAFRPDMRESDDALVARARIYVDTRAGALAEAGDLLLAQASGAFDAARVEGDLFDLCAGRVAGRSSPDEVTLFKSVGAALEDLTAAELVLARAG